MAKKTQRTYPDLKTYFEESGDTQTALALRLKRSPAWVSRVVNGETEPSITEALWISKQTGVPLESLSVHVPPVCEKENSRV